MQTLRLDFITPREASQCGAFELRERVFAHSNECSAEDLMIGCRHLVVRDGDTTVGYGKLIVDGPLARVRQICVAPDTQRSGLGSQILERLILCAREEHASTVWLLARFTALGFYQKFGFIEIGPVVPSEDSAAPHRRMELRITR